MLLFTVLVFITLPSWLLFCSRHIAPSYCNVLRRGVLSPSLSHDERSARVFLVAAAAATAGSFETSSGDRRVRRLSEKPIRTVCLYITTPDLTSLSLAAKRTSWYYTAGPGRTDYARSRVLYGQSPVNNRIPLYVDLDEFEWKAKFLGDGAFTRANYMRSWVLHGDGCDALIGPGYSFVALSLSPLVEGSKTAWIDPFATHPSLSDKDEHPSFSRMYTGGRNLAKVMTSFFQAVGWRDANIIALDDPFAAALATEVVAAMRAVNASIVMSRSFAPSAIDTFVSAMKAIDASSSSRVVYIMGFPNRDMFAIIEVLKEYDDRFIFIFPFLCVFMSGLPEYHTLKSAFCVAQSYDEDLARPFVDSYTQRNVTDDVALVASHPKTTAVNVTNFGVVTSLGHDATLHAMRALAYAQKVKVTPVVAARSIATAGFTGTIELDAAGDRLAARLQFRNARGGGRDVLVALVDESGTVRFRGPDGVETLHNVVPDLMLMGMMYKAGSIMPSSTRPSEKVGGGSGSVVLVVVLCAGGAVVVSALCIGAFMWYCRSLNARDNSNAPKDSTNPFAIVFTDIQASTALWARVPEQMSEAVDVHHATIRRLIARHHGYEVKTIGDSFMVAFHDAKAAVSFSMDVQRQLHAVVWPEGIDAVYPSALVRDVSGAGEAMRPARVWNGLRVRVGAHYGLGKIQQDPVTQGFDYYGTVVNTAARVETVGHGGQTLVTASMWAEVPSLPRTAVTPLGPQPLRGLDNSVDLIQLDPTSLATRIFPALRLSVSPDIEGGDVEGSLHGEFSCTTPNPEYAGSMEAPGSPTSSVANTRAGVFGAEVARLSRSIAARRLARALDAAHAMDPSPLQCSQYTSGGHGVMAANSTSAADGDAPSPALRPNTRGDDALSRSTRGVEDIDRDADRLALVASFLRKLLSVVPAKERQRAVAQYAKRWHAKVTTTQDVHHSTRRASLFDSGRHSAKQTAESVAIEVSEARTLMAVVERVWLTLDR